MLGRRLFLYLFTPFHLRFRYLLPVFRDSKAQGGIRGNGSKDLFKVSRQAPHRGTAMVATAPPEGLLASETEPPWALAASEAAWRPSP